MKKILVAAVALVALTGAATAETITLTSAQLDGVTAGWGWKRSNGGVNQSNSNHTSQHSSSGAVSVGGCNVVAFCGGKFSFNGNALAISSSGNENVTFQSNENGGGWRH